MEEKPLWQRTKRESTKRAFRIWEYLYNYSDQEHPVNVVELSRHLKNEGFYPKDSTIQSDIEVLLDLGYDIVVERSQMNSYYLRTSPYLH